MKIAQEQTKAAEHATAVYDLAARLGETLARALDGSVAMTGAPFNDPQLARSAMAGLFQYGLVFCALEKCAINRQADARYWAAVGQALEFMARKGAQSAAQAILAPLRALAPAEELDAIAARTDDPWRDYAGASLQNIAEGPDKTPVGVLIKQITPLFYAKADHSAVADKIVQITFEAVKVLFTDGGLA